MIDDWDKWLDSICAEPALETRAGCRTRLERLNAAEQIGLAYRLSHKRRWPIHWEFMQFLLRAFHHEIRSRRVRSERLLR